LSSSTSLSFSSGGPEAPPKAFPDFAIFLSSSSSFLNLPRSSSVIENIGDYKLKSSSDYEVPDKERMNMSKQKKHILLLEKFIYSVKMDFNKSIEKLREKKLQTIEKIKNTNIRIGEINSELE